MAFTPKNWEDSPSTSTPITAAALEDLETRVTDYTDDEVAGVPGPGSVDTVDAALLVEPTGTTQNGVIVKAPADTWGDGTDYGEAQAFVLFREDNPDTSEPEPDRNVLFRVNGWDGGLGTAGGIHTLYGFRQHDDWAAVSSDVWIQGFVPEVPKLLVSGAPSQTEDIFRITDDSGTQLFNIAADGKLELGGDSGANLYRSADNVVKTDGALLAGADFAARSGGAGQVAMGDNGAGKATITFGTAGDTNLYRDSANVLKTDDAFTATGAITSSGLITAETGEATQVQIGNVGGFGVPLIQFGTDTSLFRSAAGIINVTSAFSFSEIADPTAPAANGGILYTKDNGSGKTQLAVRFNTGAVQIIATQP